MKTQHSNRYYAFLLLLLAGTAVPASAQSLHLLSAPDASEGAVAVGGGDSGSPVISADGRHVLFASAAGNLVLTSSNTPVPFRSPPALNVFLRDRTNGTTVLVSVNLTGTSGGNGDSLPVGISTNGRYVVFESSASDLVAGDTNGLGDVFARDLVTGTTILVSAGTNGGPGDAESRSAVMTRDGHYVAFLSTATNLVAEGDTNGLADVFVRDLQAGVTVRASTGTKTGGQGVSDSPDITPDGYYVAFCSNALNTREIYVRDLDSGALIHASAGAGAAATAVLKTPMVVCYNHAFSADGRFVVYETSRSPNYSPAYPGLILRYSLETGLTDLVHTNAAIHPSMARDIRNLAMTPDGQKIVFVASTNGTSGATTCILLWDATTGGTTLVSGDLGGQVPANSACDWPAIDASGRYVVFSSTATNLTTNTLSGEYHLYLRDLQAGITTLLDADASGVGSPVGPFAMPRLSADGRFVAFECGDGNLVANDRNQDTDVFVRDLSTGGVELISARDASLPSLTANGPSQLSTRCASADGRYIVFASEADNLVPGDTNGFRDIFVRDLVEATNLLVSVGTNGMGANGLSYGPAISGNGRYVAFTSHATNLVVGDNNRASDVFVRDLQTGTTTLASVNRFGTVPGDAESDWSEISSDGRYVLFQSRARNLVMASFTGATNLFVRDLQAGTNYALTTNGLSCAAMTPDGRFVAFADVVGPIANKLHVWASALARRVYTNSTSGVTNVAISPDGNRIACLVDSIPRQLFVANRAAGTSGLVSTNSPLSRLGLRFSADSRFLVYTARVSQTNQVCLYDCVGGTSLLISRSHTSGSPAYGHSDSPDISPDGRFVAYRSAASNIVPGDTNGVPDIFFFDRQTGVTMLLTASRFGNFAADNRSLCPVFTAGGQNLVFQTWASDLAEADFNRSGDVVVYSLFSSAPIPLFYAAIHPAGASGASPWLTWPAVPGRSYRVQFKNSLIEPDWQELGGSVTVIGNQGYCQDLAPAAAHRFYRIVGY
ncbi:MAG TPA: hypothetical protein P5205_06300 [Candidatus Paceibacterota bacterium]|nr:hypothetical protein [Verrucomicrobiota bacterium]HSA09966.1 hypothetical protein [Candidatus Paceibacterota bacterium]